MSPQVDLGQPCLPVCCPSACVEGREYFWVSAEYLLWFVQGSPVPFPLVTTSTGGTTPAARDTRVLFGGGNVNGSDPYSGLRIRAGSYLDGLGFGVDLSGFALENKATAFAIASDASANPILGRPFLNADTGVESVNLISFPNAVVGGVAVRAETRVWGGEANLSRKVALGPVEMLYAGFRYLGMRDQIGISDRTTLLPGGLGFFDGLPIAEGDVRLKNDLFRARNDFYGGQVGFRAAVRRGALDVQLRSLVALGVMHESLTVQGSTTLVTAAGTRTTLPGGLLAAGPNLSKQTRSEFAVVPEVDLSIGYQLFGWARVFVGYNFLYSSAVIRAGTQMDRAISPAQLPIAPTFDPAVTSTNPRPLFKPTDFWTQGVNFGLSVSF